MGTQSGDAAFSTYERFAEIYNDFNHQNDYEMWLGRKLLPELERRGARKGRVLDVGCGTGRAFEPLLKRGWEIRGCDISPAMLAIARRQFPGVELEVADMRELPVYGEFELVLIMNDAVNYLIGEGEPERTMAAVRANLAPDGLVLFDSNSLEMYRLAYESVEDTVEKGGRTWTWTGLGRDDGELPIYRVEIAGDVDEPIVNEERYFPIPEVEAAMEGGGLEVVAVLGQREEDEEVVLSEPADDEGDHKIVYIGRPA
jgi:SAM-dependent methyltransferase